MIINILLFLILSLLTAWVYFLNKKIEKIINQENIDLKTEEKKDPYKDWRDPVTGLLKSKKNTMI